MAGNAPDTVALAFSIPRFAAWAAASNALATEFKGSLITVSAASFNINVAPARFSLLGCVDKWFPDRPSSPSRQGC